METRAKDGRDDRRHKGQIDRQTDGWMDSRSRLVVMVDSRSQVVHVQKYNTLLVTEKVCSRRVGRRQEIKARGTRKDGRCRHKSNREKVGMDRERTGMTGWLDDG